ncbi:hypothetical protein JW711_03665 [Candidatus Woesearchaeota archaeon]|nr:hypothetical protein [Candidatus Woesearchaeota archaeon]
MADSVFRGTLGFFMDLGIYDVVLPFLLVFTIVFAILEKTKAFGLEKIGDREYTRKNLNAMVAFVAAFFVVASAQLVAIVNEVLANTVLLLLVSICFLLLAGSFHKGDKEFALEGGWNTAFMVIMFIGIVLIFFNAVGWLPIIWEAIFYKFDSVTVSSIILIIAIVAFMWYITGGVGPKEEKDKKS